MDKINLHYDTIYRYYLSYSLQIDEITLLDIIEQHEGIVKKHTIPTIANLAGLFKMRYS